MAKNVDASRGKQTEVDFPARHTHKKGYSDIAEEKKIKKSTAEKKHY